MEYTIGIPLTGMPMRPFGSPLQLEKRRLKAVEKLSDGISLNEIARQIGCSPSSVMRWRDAWQANGKTGLKPKPAPGRPSRLRANQKSHLTKMLLKGAMHNGYRTELWTTTRIAELIEKKWGVKYHRDHICRLMASLRWSYQKPEKRALERDEAAIANWRKRRWPTVKKTPKGWAPISYLSTNPASC